MNISIIITTYNAARFIKSTLDSIRQQSFQSYEVVIVDDGSEDNTVVLVKEYIEQHGLKTFRIITMPHIGRAKALNCGVKQALYDWVAIIDADDLWNINKLAIQIEYINRFELEGVATRCSMFEQDKEFNIFKNFSTHKINKDNLQKADLSRMILFNMIPHSSILIKKHLLKYDESRISQIDYELWLRLLYQGVELYLIELELMGHRIHQNQSFEAKKPFSYSFRASILQLKYCFYCIKPMVACYVFIKLFYYMVANRKIKRWLGNKFNSRASFENQL